MRGLAHLSLGAALLAAPTPLGPTYAGDPSAESKLAETLAAAHRGTEGFGPWPEGAWTVHLHIDPAAFERSTGAPPRRAALWLGNTLHLRPWEQLRRRALGPLLRHELTHRRLARLGLPRWEEEARCLWAEEHGPRSWPPAPPPSTCRALDQALAAGNSERQAWAYRCLRAWLEGHPLPAPPPHPPAENGGWSRTALPAEEPVVVRWPPERLPRDLEVNGRRLPLQPGRRWSFPKGARFGPGSPVDHLDGRVDLQAGTTGWTLHWTCTPTDWVAAATEGELGAQAPAEARRALAGLLARWREGRREHGDGSLCPLTHCAVVRGSASPATRSLAASAPRVSLLPDALQFCGSQGGIALSPREVWGSGTSTVQAAESIPGDRWAAWVRSFSPAEVAALKAAVPPGLKPGQRGLKLGSSGPYAVETLRLEAGRRFGWARWPSNACEAQELPDGGVRIEGHGWGHNVGLCLSSAQAQARRGWKAEAILEAAFGPGVCSERASR